MLTELIRYEHEIQRVTSAIERKGLLVDVEYTSDLQSRMETEIGQWRDIALSLGCSNVEAPRSVSAALEAFSEFRELMTETTETGQRKANKDVLAKLEESAEPGSPGANLIEAIQNAKRLSKRKSSYVDHMLQDRDANDRIHASINPLGARTARMSVSAPPFQQLPSGEALIRKCIIAPPGYVIMSCDFQQIEMKVAAVFAGEGNMIRAAQQGVSIHEVTSSQLFGPDYTKAQYKLGKAVGFTWLYGGGDAKVAKTSGVPLSEAQEVVRKYNERFPNLSAYKRSMTEQVLRNALTLKQYRYYSDLRKKMWDYEEGTPERERIRETMHDITSRRTAPIYTPSGRRLIVDAERAYAATNYMVQSTARDIMASALLRVMGTPSLRGTVLMPIHDEILAEVPETKAEVFCEAFSELMSTSFGPVPITTEAEVCGRSWGDAYE